VSDITVKATPSQVPLVLGIDVGTSAVRSMLFDQAGRVIQGTEANEAYKFDLSQAGAAEVAADLLLESIFASLDATLAKAGRLAGQIRGVGSTTFVTNILGVGRDGRAVTPVYAYSDTRAEEDAANLRAQLDEAAVHDRTGCRIHTSYLPARFVWLSRVNPERFRRAQRWMSIGEYLFLHLFGKTVVSYSVASWTGLLDRRKLDWDEPLLEVLPVGAGQFSPLVDVDMPLFGLTPDFGRRWPALRNIPWFPTVGDGAAANVGSGCASPSRRNLSLGSTTALRMVTEEPGEDLPPSLWCYRVDARRSLVGGALTEGGNAITWMTSVLNLRNLPSLENALATMPPDAHGLTVLPFFAGERSPGWAGDVRAVISGLSLSTTPLEILRAELEAIALRLALVHDDLAKFAPEPNELVVTGGAAFHSPALLQIIADALGRAIRLSTFPEASCRGAALLALEALGIRAEADPARELTGPAFHADPDRHRIYCAAQERQQKLYRRLIATG
jgi:gluconokinase